MSKADSGCCSACGCAFDVNRVVKCQVCGKTVRYLRCSNPEKPHHVAFELGYPEVQKKHSHVEWELKSAFGEPLMASVKKSNVRDAEEILGFMAGIAADMHSFVDGYNDRNGITILQWVYKIENPQMVQLFERYV